MSTVSFGPPDRPQRGARSKALRFLLAILLLVAAWLGAFAYYRVAWDRGSVLVGVGVTLGYLIVGYFVDFEPDLENLGIPTSTYVHKRLPSTAGSLWWWPTRWLWEWDDWTQRSDNISRSVLFLRALFGPGKFIATALSDPLFPGDEARRD